MQFFLCIWDWTGISYSDFVRKAVVVKGGLERSK
jgi:hypothetical protein